MAVVAGWGVRGGGCSGCGLIGGWSSSARAGRDDHSRGQRQRRAPGVVVLVDVFQGRHLDVGERLPGMVASPDRHVQRVAETMVRSQSAPAYVSKAPQRETTPALQQRLRNWCCLQLVTASVS